MMTTSDTGSPNEPSIADRVKNILLKPAEEWARIDAEPATIGSIYRGYVLSLAAIGPVAGLIGGQVFGYGAFGFHYRPSLAGSISSALIGYALALVGVYLLALIIDWLAPNFGATRDRVRAFKVAAYSATAGWVAGVFQLIPALAFLAILGLYSLYLLYLGLPRLMKAPADRAMPYTILTIVVAVVLGFCAAMLISPLAGLFAFGGSGPAGVAGGTFTTPGGGAVDVGRLEQASKRIEAAAKGAHDGSLVITPAADLQALFF